MTMEYSKGNVQTKRDRVFEIESKTLVFSRRKWIYSIQTSRLGTHHVNIMEHALCFWHVGLSKNEQQTIADYHTFCPWI